MDSFVFFFENIYQKDFLTFVDTINKKFEYFFGIQYSGLEYFSYEKVMGYRDEDKVLRFVPHKGLMDDIRNEVYFWENNFAITIELPEWPGHIKTFENFLVTLRKFSENAAFAVPVLGILSWDGTVNMDEDMSKDAKFYLYETNPETYSYVVYRKENNIIQKIK